MQESVDEIKDKFFFDGISEGRGLPPRRIRRNNDISEQPGPAHRKRLPFDLTERKNIGPPVAVFKLAVKNFHFPVRDKMEIRFASFEFQE